MINKNNFQTLLKTLGFEKQGDIYSKKFGETVLKIDINNEKIIYPEDKGLKVNDKTTSNFSSNENFVVLECVHRLLTQGYQPQHIELEPRWQLGHGAKGGKADILIKDNAGKSILIIECKTAGSEFTKAWNQLQTEPTQIFSYVQQERNTKFIAIYASDFIDAKVNSNYYLINLQDNKKLLENNQKLKSFADATTTEGLHQVWCETYQKDYATIGLFEDNKPYEIGKTKFKVADLKNITSNDIQGKYHEFATILRKYSVSGRENAFDKLVNLFLCKTTDELKNPNELKLYWKGIAYDNPFDFQDRLQRLYTDGMEDFLGEEITYIDDKQIDDVFSVFKNKPNTTKESIKQMLKKQKFFTNNDFAFIDVHNEKLFYQNFEVLLAIANIIQDISLLGSEENQFLGDMFEGFLDQGVKQHEGQFFTPMPIVKFIVNSLPSITTPKVIDYACGSGHFLNEYINLDKTAQITGIEKEYRLSKIAKVSSMMYGSNIDVIYTDALAKNSKIKNNTYNVLIANPPYAVKGFLETLSETDRQQFELINAVDSKSYSKNGSIECFFIERAKQLLKSGGVAGIILPNSILNKDTPKLYIKVREIILSHFEIKAIAEFGTGTFGKTGTNTVTLFLKRRNTNEKLAEHLKNMVNTWFDCDFQTNKNFTDENLLSDYCQHINIDLEIYKKMLCGRLDEALFKQDIFKEYREYFDQLTTTKNRKKTQTYKAKTNEQQQETEQKALIAYIFEIEKDKMLFFGLSRHNGQVIIVKSPVKNSEIKNFLGYEWGGGKGNEGIKYLTTNSINDESLSDEDKRVLANLQGVKSIKTPLYNPQNLADKSKINTIIKQNFEDKEINIPDELSPFVSTANLVDMLDFSRVKFGKEINLNSVKKIEIKSKYPLEKIDKVLELIRGVTYAKTNQSLSKTKSVILTADNITLKNEFFIKKEIYLHNSFNIDNRKKLSKDDIFICLSSGSIKHLGKIAYIKDDTEYYAGGFMGILRAKENIITQYAFNILGTRQYKEILEYYGKGMNINNLSSSISEIKIPLPPLKIQKQIVSECQKVDKTSEQAQQTINQAKVSVDKIINSIEKTTTLDKVVNKVSDSLNPNHQDGMVMYIGLEHIQGNSGVLLNNKKTDFRKIKSNKNIFQKGDILYGKLRPNLNKVYLAEMGGICSTDILVLRPHKSDIAIVYKHFLLSKSFNTQVIKTISGQQLPRTSWQKINKFLAPPKIQQTMVNKITKLEQQITQAQAIINNSSELKNNILKKYL